MVFKHATCDGGSCIVRNTQMALQKALGMAFCTSALLPFPDKWDDDVTKELVL